MQSSTSARHDVSTTEASKLLTVETGLLQSNERVSDISRLLILTVEEPAYENEKIKYCLTF